MKCSIQGCPGNYERRLIIHTVGSGDEMLLFEDVPADVCDVCSDTLLAPDTILHIEKMMKQHVKPRKHVPVYAYA